MSPKAFSEILSILVLDASSTGSLISPVVWRNKSEREMARLTPNIHENSGNALKLVMEIKRRTGCGPPLPLRVGAQWTFSKCGGPLDALGERFGIVATAQRRKEMSDPVRFHVTAGEPRFHACPNHPILKSVEKKNVTA